MSRSFTTRPTLANTRGRGRGTQTRNTPAMGPGADDTGIRPSAPRGTGIGGVAGRGVGPPNPPNTNAEPGQRMTYQGGYTLIAPNERKRQQIAEMAKKEEDAYASHKEKNTQKTFSYVGTVGGGQVTQAQARQQTVNSSPTKTGKLMAQQQRKSFVKQAEEQEMQKKKETQRLKTKQNEVKGQRESTKWDDQRRRTNEAFLRRLENQSKPSDTGQSSNDEENPGLVSANLQGTSDPAPITNMSMNMGTKPRASNQTSQGAEGSTAHEYSNPGNSHEYASSSGNNPGQRLTIEEQKRLNALAMIFPHIEETMLIEILQQVGFSVDSAITLLQC